MLQKLSPSLNHNEDYVTNFFRVVQKTYRAKPYHNWTHALQVAHCMFYILEKNGDLFSELEKVSMFVAALAHDVDHRGYSNQFLQKTKHPLARLYASSTMERHHLNLALSVLGAPGCDVFHCFSGDKSSTKKALDLFRTSILATDLAYYFTNRVKIEQSLAKDTFDFEDPEWRLVMTIVIDDFDGIHACAR